jgi:hypothetical protein
MEPCVSFYKMSLCHPIQNYSNPLSAYLFHTSIIRHYCTVWCNWMLMIREQNEIEKKEKEKVDVNH